MDTVTTKAELDASAGTYARFVARNGNSSASDTVYGMDPEAAKRLLNWAVGQFKAKASGAVKAVKGE